MIWSSTQGKLHREKAGGLMRNGKLGLDYNPESMCPKELAMSNTGPGTQDLRKHVLRVGKLMVHGKILENKVKNTEMVCWLEIIAQNEMEKSTVSNDCKENDRYGRQRRPT